MVCHGGGPALNGAKKVENARFREFDLPSFRYSGNRSWDYGQGTLNATELGNFAKLNQMVRDFDPRPADRLSDQRLVSGRLRRQSGAGAADPADGLVEPGEPCQRVP